MKKEINIAAILKDKPKGIRLYSPIFGECAFSFIQDVTDAIFVTKHNGGREFFNTKGLYETLGECLLFPSKSMRDWSKFAWKKGDVLVSNDSDSHIIFTGFSKNDYTTFEGKHWISVSKKRHISYLDIQKTQCYHIEDDKEAVQTYINTIEERLGGKLNLETLEIEKSKPEFKDGDIVTITFNWGEDIVYIFKSENSNSYSYYAWLNGSIPTIIESSHPKSDIYTVRLSTEQEKKKLFDALAKENKTWDSEKKQIVDLKPNVDELKPFDKVLVKDNPYGSWEPALFWKKVDVKDLHPYMIIGGKRYRYCEPYEGNENLLDD